MIKHRAIIACLVMLVILGLIIFAYCRGANAIIPIGLVALMMVLGVYFRKWAGFDKLSPMIPLVFAVFIIALIFITYLLTRSLSR